MSEVDISTLLSPGRTVPDTAETALAAMYEKAGLDSPEFIWTASPMAGFQRVQEELKGLHGRDILGLATESMLVGLAKGRCLCPWCRGLSVADLVHTTQGVGWPSGWPVSRTRTGEEVVLDAVRRDLAVHSAERLHPGLFSRIRRSWGRPYGNPWTASRVAGTPWTDGPGETDPSMDWLWLAASAGWWWPYEGFAVLSARPEGMVSVDDELHCEDGPVLVYPDGWSINAVRNVLLPDTVFEPGGLTVIDVSDEANLEVRRILIDLYGPDRYVEDVRGTMAHEDATGQLWRLDGASSGLGRAGTMAMVRVVDATPQSDGAHRVYWLHVPPNLKTAREAVAWTFGMRPADYRPEVET